MNNLRQRTLTGLGWTGATRLLAQILQFAATVVLARLLSPKEYGLLGMVLGEQFGIWIHTKKLDVSHAASVCLVGERYDRQLYNPPSHKTGYESQVPFVQNTEP